MSYKSYKSNRSYKSYSPVSGPGYEKLVVYWIAVTISDLTPIFCEHYIPKFSRTFDQMVQASRSGKQCLVEGNLGRSIESLLKLSDISRNSYGELLEDFKDYIRQHNLTMWPKEDPRVVQIRRTLDLPYKSYKSNKTYTSYMNSPEEFANLMITLCFKQLYLMDKFLLANERRFVKQGGFRENLFKRRLSYRNGPQ